MSTPTPSSPRSVRLGAGSSRRGGPTEVHGVLTEAQERDIAGVHRAIYHAYVIENDPASRRRTLNRYLKAKYAIARRTGRFGIVNNRVFRSSDALIIPYLLADTLVVYRVTQEATETLGTANFAAGTVLTDDHVTTFAGVETVPIDLEKDLFEFDSERAKPIRIAWLRDIAAQLERVNESANRNEAVYVLRCLVAHLCSMPFRACLKAKNLQTEMYNLLSELTRFLNTPLSSRLPFLVRVLVRNVGAVVLKPRLIDRVWDDTVDLAEIHIRGSSIVKELRRSSHHALGKRTLLLARAYLDYLESAKVDGLAELGFPTPTPADEEARTQTSPKKIVARVALNLEEILGTAEIMARLREWQTEYVAVVLRCEFGRSLSEEVEEAVNKGVRERNRWVYYRHLGIIKKRLAEFFGLGHRDVIERGLEALLALKPDESDFDVEGTEKELRQVVEDFISDLRSTFQADLLGALNAVMEAYDRKSFYESFADICQLRKTLRSSLKEHAFPEQHLFLCQLDCLLEEMSYLTLRHIATGYEENGLPIRQCFDVIYACVQNLTHDGLYSRELLDMAGILTDKTKTYAEIANVLDNMQRNYHRILQRVTVSFERMRERLGLEEGQLRTALANMQRQMHDLNSMVQFCDMARSHIRDQVRELSGCIDRDPAVPLEEAAAFDILHLSHHDEIKRRVENHETSGSLRDRFGAKGSGLIYISYLDIPTRDGFILPTTFRRLGPGSHHEARLHREVVEHVTVLESDIAKRDGMPKRFGDTERPLLLAVRSGSPFSMPGMLSTIVFLGMNDEIAETLAREDPWHAYDCYRRFLASYGRAVWGLDIEAHDVVEETKRRYGVRYKYDVPWEGMKEVAEATKAILRNKGYGERLDELLEDPAKQLLTAIHAVFDSWNSDTARRYREVKGLCHSWHTAVIVQEMSSGNRRNEEIRVGMDETHASLTGVIPNTRVTDHGFRTCTGEFKYSAAGDDLVGGITTSISFSGIEELALYMPMLNRRLRHIVAKLRRFMGVDQEVEFTIERGVLSVLQSRAAQGDADEHGAAFVDAGTETTSGVGIRGGAFRGVVAFDEADLRELANEDLHARDDVDGVLMVVDSPTPESIPLILSASGLLAARGGSTSHAAVAINGVEDKDYAAVMSAAGLQVNARSHGAIIVDNNGNVCPPILKGDVVSIHGMTGKVYIGSRQIMKGT